MQVGDVTLLKNSLKNVSLDAWVSPQSALAWLSIYFQKSKNWKNWKIKLKKITNRKWKFLFETILHCSQLWVSWTIITSSINQITSVYFENKLVLDCFRKNVKREKKTLNKGNQSLSNILGLHCIYRCNILSLKFFCVVCIC